MRASTTWTDECSGRRPRAQRAFALKAVFDGTWSITVEDRAPLTVVVMARGRATFTGHHVRPRWVRATWWWSGARRPTPSPTLRRRPEDIRILPGQVCVDPHGRLLAADMELDLRTWGNTRSEDATVMLIGTYQQETSVGSLLLSKLPAELVIRDLEPALIGLFAQEIVSDEPGRSPSSIGCSTCWSCAACGPCSRGQVPRGTTWSNARSAPSRNSPTPVDRRVVGDAGRVVAGCTRATLRLQMGEPPLTYLTRWRLALAADLLVSTDDTLAAIASKVGYANAFALSAAFKRVNGESPRDYRDSHTA